MGLLKLILVPALVAVAAYITYATLVPAKKLEFPRDGWFGTGKKSEDDVTISPFKVSVPEAVLEDLKRRLADARISHEILEDSDSFEYGFNVNYLKKVVEHWQTKFDWRKQEAILNAWPQYTTEIEGVKVHFYHAKPDAKKYKKILPMLLDPVAHKVATRNDIAFEVILIGTIQASLNSLLLAFYLQGGDWGSMITSQLARIYPESVYGLHLNMAVNPIPTSPLGLFYTVVGSIVPQQVLLPESGYFHIQATKPDTVGTGLNDSPLGLATYILEKFSTWTNPEYRKMADGGLTKSEIWAFYAKGSIVASQRFYKEHYADPVNSLVAKQYITVPTAHAQFPNDVFDTLPAEIIATGMNHTSQAVMPDGGHFAAFEQPFHLAAHLFDFVSGLERK